MCVENGLASSITLNRDAICEKHLASICDNYNRACQIWLRKREIGPLNFKSIPISVTSSFGKIYYDLAVAKKQIFLNDALFDMSVPTCEAN